MSLLQNSSLFFLVTFIAMVLAVSHGEVNASRTVMDYETSTSTSHPLKTTSGVPSPAYNATGTAKNGLNSSFSSSSKLHASSTIFKLSNTSSSLAAKPAMSGDNNEKKAEAHEENGNVKITGDGFVEVNISQLSIGVCLGQCYKDLQICYDAQNPSSELPQRICGYSGQCGLRFGTFSKNSSRVWFMEEGKYTAERDKVAECQYANIHPGLIEFVYPRHTLGAEDVGCTLNIISGKYMKISVKGASKDCPVLIKNAKLKPEPTTTVPGAIPDGRTTEEASTSQLSIWVPIGIVILFIIIVAAIIGFVCWKKRQNKAKQQLPPAKPMKAIMDKPVENSGPGESAIVAPVEPKPAVKEEKALVPIPRDVDVEKVESAVKEEKILAPVDHDVEKAEPAPMKPQVIVEAKKPEPVEHVEETKLVKEAKEIVKDHSLVVDETQKDKSKPRKTASKKKSKSKKKKPAKVAAVPPPPLPTADAAATKEDAPSKEAPAHLPLNLAPRVCAAAAKKIDHLRDDHTQRSTNSLRPGDICRRKPFSHNEKRKADRERLSACAQDCLHNLKLLGYYDADYEMMERFYPHIRGRKVLDIEKDLFAGSVNDMVLQMDVLCKQAHLILVDEGFQFNADLQLFHVSSHGHKYLKNPSTPHYVAAFAFGASFEQHVQHAPIHYGEYSLPLLFITLMTPRIPLAIRTQAGARLLNFMIYYPFEGVDLASKCFPVNFIHDIYEYRQKKKEAALKKASNETYESKETRETE